MGYEEDKHPHRVSTPYSQKTYWSKSEESGYICAGNELNCSMVELRSRKSSYPSLSFEMPRQKHELAKVERLMQDSYERGQIDQKAAIGKMMRELVEL